MAMVRYSTVPAVMEVGLTEVQPKFSLPSVVSTGSSLQLSSLIEMEEIDGHQYKRPLCSYFSSSSPSYLLPQVLPSASSLTSQTYVGPRRNHPQLRMRIYEILQHRVGL